MATDNAAAKPAWLKKVAHTCPRCGMEFRAVSEYKRHLAKKNLCKPTLADVSLDDEIEKYVTNTPPPTKRGPSATSSKAASVAPSASDSQPEALADEQPDSSGEKVSPDAAPAAAADEKVSPDATAAVDEKVSPDVATATAAAPVVAKPAPPAAPAKKPAAPAKKPAAPAAAKPEAALLGDELLLRVRKLEDAVFQRDKHHTCVFGLETTWHVDATFVRRYVDEPLQCVLKVVTDIFFNDKFPENQTVRYIDNKFEVRRGGGWTSFGDKKDDLLLKVAGRAIDVVDCVASGVAGGLDEFITAFRNGEEELLQTVANELDTQIFMNHLQGGAGAADATATASVPLPATTE